MATACSKETILRCVNFIPPFLKDEKEFGSMRTADEHPVEIRESLMARKAREGSEIVNNMARQRALLKAKTDYTVRNPTARPTEAATKEPDEPADDRMGAQMPETTQTRQQIRAAQQALPIFKMRQGILDTVFASPVTVVVGSTGSGKTTQLPQYILEATNMAGKPLYPGSIVCTQPRRVAAVGVAHRVAVERGAVLGGEVGYSIRFEDVTSDQTKLRYVTEGVLIRELMTAPTAAKYSVIIIDEAHERTINTDLLFGLLKQALGRHRGLRVIVMSATLEAEKFRAFFSPTPPLIEIKTKPYPVECLHTIGYQDDYVDSAVNQVLEIHRAQGACPGDVLVFMTGQEDIDATCDILEQRAAELLADGTIAHPLLVLPMYGMLKAEEQMRIFSPPPPGTRKVIVSTNIAETSLTVDGIVHVVDTGLAKLKVFSAPLGMDALKVCPVSQASAMQRTGRAGRTQPGRCYRLYPETAFTGDLLESTVPELHRSNLANICLTLLKMGESPHAWAETGLFLDPPSKEALNCAMRHLWMLEAVTDEGRLTRVGEVMAVFPLDPVLSRMLLAGEHYRCLSEVLTIIAMLSVPSVWYSPAQAAEKAKAERQLFQSSPDSDHLALLRLYSYVFREDSRTSGKPKRKLQFVNMQNMVKAKKIREQIRDMAKKYGLNPATTTLREDNIKKAIARALLINVAECETGNRYSSLLTGAKGVIHSTSALYDQNVASRYIVFNELVQTKQIYLRTVTAVDPNWISDMRPDIFRTGSTGPVTRKSLALAAVPDNLGAPSVGPVMVASRDKGRRARRKM
ncbi:Helicase associated domain (HA2) [Carpediemonas membranifera]|uniref:RNA helicase n=1 Tax=Carpediemonas membranifera TaxID=201153 RepID=A0A8J6BUA3_9EUKA|nr:Helicase associated domain (HA2) [Carpediemonas membranifera]|eukprot:KAG9390141.1 Helicase associated domain (HA2) [Carpediemonas membranifera]